VYNVIGFRNDGDGMMDYLDLLITEEEAQKRACRLYFRSWLWMLLLLIILFASLNAVVWFAPVGTGFYFKVGVTSVLTISWAWLGWDTSKKWRHPKTPKNLLKKVEETDD
jgi:hypothetical protein